MELKQKSLINICVAQLKAYGWEVVQMQETGANVHFQVHAPGAVSQIIGAASYALPLEVRKLGGPEGYHIQQEVTHVAETKRFAQSGQNTNEPVQGTMKDLMTPGHGDQVTISTRLAGEVTLTKRLVDGKYRLYVPEGVAWRVYHKGFGTCFWGSIQILKWALTDWEIRLVRGS